MNIIKKFQTLIASVLFVAAAVGVVITFQELPGQVTDLKAKIVKLEKEHSEEISALEKELDVLNTKVTLNEKRIDQEVLNTGVEDIFKN